MDKTYIVISCYTIENELMKIMEEHGVDWPVYFIPPHLHGDMDQLHEYLQNLIDGIRNVDAILLTISRCGGGTVGLKATSADLILPRGADCIDLLLSEKAKTLPERDRPLRSIFVTESWLNSMEDMGISYETLCEEHGEEVATEMIKAMYDQTDYYYIVDTDTYDTEMVGEYLAPQAEMQEMEIRTMPGQCGTLHKLVTGQFDNDFAVIKQGNTVCESDFFLM